MSNLLHRSTVDQQRHDADVLHREVRRVLKAAGIPFVKKSVSSNIKGGWTTIEQAGASVSKVTEYQTVNDYGERRKMHVPTGDVRVEVDLSSGSVYRSDQDRAQADLDDLRSRVADALRAAGFEPTEGLVVSR